MNDRPVLLSVLVICNYSSICDWIDSECLHLSNPFQIVEYNEAEYSVFPLKSILNNTPGVLLQFCVCVLSQSRTHSSATRKVPFAPSLYITTAFWTRWCFASMQLAGHPRKCHWIWVAFVLIMVKVFFFLFLLPAVLWGGAVFFHEEVCSVWQLF